MLTKNKYFIFSIILFLTTYLLFGLTNFSFIDSFRDSYEDTIVDPITYISLFSAAVSFILLFFSSEIFKLWLRKIVSWFLPISTLIILINGDGQDIVGPDRTDLAIFFGFILVVVTLVFALVQKFKYKR